MVLSERRVGETSAIEAAYGEAVSVCPELRIVLVDRIPDSTEWDVCFVKNHRDLKGFGEWAGSLGGEKYVFCAQELCHQVTAVYRYQ